MNKTLHKKLTEKNLYACNAWQNGICGEDMLLTARQEINLLQEAAKEMLQPRPEAIAFILNMSRSM